MPTEIPFDKNNAEYALGAAIIAFNGAMEKAIEALASEKGTADMTWFDDLRSEMVLGAKGTITEQLSIEVEATALTFGLKSLEASLDSIRRRLVEE